MGEESGLNKSLIESLVQLFGMMEGLRRGGGFIRGSNGSPEKLKNYFNVIISHFHTHADIQ